MKAISALGIILVDLDRNGLGLPSLAAEPFGGSTVLGETLRRLACCQAVDRWVLSVPPNQVERVRALVDDTWFIEPSQSAEPPWLARARRGRKWSLDGWRGGIGRSTIFDEESNPAEFARLAGKHHADWVVQVRAESPLVDPRLVDGIALRAKSSKPAPPLLYGSIPPGLAGWAYRPDFLAELAATNLHPGFVLGYRAWEPTIDLTEQLFAYKAPIEISRFATRLLADNRRSLSLLRQFENETESLEAAALIERLERHPEWLVPPAPLEIEIEITTRRGVGHRHLPAVDRPPMTIDAWTRIVTQYAAANDVSLVTMAGHGDPLLHPDWAEMVQAARQAGVYGMSLVTDGANLTDETIERLLSSWLDVLCVRLDGSDRSTYATVHGEDRYDDVVSGLRRYLARRAEIGQDHPLLVVTLTRCEATAGGMMAFYDEWSTHADAAVIAGHSDFAGQMPADGVLNLVPPGRVPCRRLDRRMMIHSDGTVVSCSEDFDGQQTVGSALLQPLGECWNSGEMSAIREAHEARNWSQFPLCPRCREWSRP